VSDSIDLIENARIDGDCKKRKKYSNDEDDNSFEEGEIPKQGTVQYESDDENGDYDDEEGNTGTMIKNQYDDFDSGTIVIHRGDSGDNVEEGQ